MYLKLDKKLIVHLDQLNVSKGAKKFDIGNLKRDILTIPYILKYFQSINLDKINFDGEIYSLVFSKNKFRVSSNDFTIDTIPKFYGHNIELELDNLLIKKHDLNLNGKLTINLFKNEAYYLGDIFYKKNKLNLNIKSTLEDIDFYIQSDDIQNINFVKDFIRLDESIEQWLYSNVKGVHNIDYLTFKYDLVKNKLDINSLELNSNIKNATVKFHDKLATVDTDNVNIIYKDSDLQFKFTNPVYKSVPLDKSTLLITNIDNEKKSMLHLDLYTISNLNDDIKEILAGYDITIPVKQYSGKLTTNIKIDLDLQTDEVNTQGKINLVNSDLEIGNLKLYAKDALILIENSELEISSEHTFLFDKQLDVKIKQLSINTQESMVNGKLFIYSFLIKNNGTTVLNLENKETSIDIDFNDDINIILDELKTTVHSDNTKTAINIKSIKDLVGSSSVLIDNKIYDGDLFILFQENDDIHFTANIFDHESALIVNNIKLLGTLVKDKLKIVSSDKKLTINSHNNHTTVKIDSIDIDKEKLPEFKNDDKSGLFTLSATKSNIIFNKEDNKILLADTFIYTSSYKNSEFTLHHKNTKLSLNTKNNRSKIDIQNIDKEFLNSFLGNGDFITSGNINITGTTVENNDKVFKGEIDLKDTNLKDFAALNQIITLIQSSSAIANPILALPTLFRVVKGDLTLNGYKALKGKIKYVYNHKNQFLNLYDIKTTGAEIDFDGDAKIDLEKRTIDSKIRVVFLKDITLIAEKLPIVNKIFLDDKKRISSEIKIYGDLDNPKSEFNLLK